MAGLKTRDLCFVFAKRDVCEAAEEFYGWPAHLLWGRVHPRTGPVARARQVLMVALLAADWPGVMIDELLGGTPHQREVVMQHPQIVAEGVSVAARADELWRARTGAPSPSTPCRVVCNGCGERFDLGHLRRCDTRTTTKGQRT